DIDKETIPFVPNFDGSHKEPVVLPGKLPNLLLNGTVGIAVGMATNIPPHNLTEIVDATITLVQEPATSLKDILKIVKGPDFPTGAFIHGKSGIAEAYKSGRGRFMMRAKAAIENLSKDRQAIVITEIPFQVNKARLIERIADLVNDKVVDDVGDIRDESDRDGMRIVIELKRGGEPQLVLTQLYTHTQMQESFSMIFLAVVNGQPREMGLIPAIQHFIDHRVEVVRRRTAYLLARAKEREHILEGYKIALDNLDAVIKLIRASKSRLEARDGLSERFKLTQRQADAILDLQLHRLTQLAKEEILNELKEVRARIEEYESILASEKKLRGVIVKELEEVKKEYGDERRTQIVDEAAEIELEDLIADEQVAVTVTHSGYLKRTPISTYRQQRRGGTGRKGAGVREEDFVEHLFIASTHAYLLIFTNTGRVYWLKVYEVPDVGAAGKGKVIANLVALQPGESVRAVLPVRDLEEEGKFVFFATRNGTVKKTELKDFCNVMSRGIIAIGIDKGDELVGARLTDGQQVVFLASHEGQAIRFEEEDVRPMGRPAYGVRGMDLEKNDYVVGLAVTPKAAPAKKEAKKKAEGEEKPERQANMILSMTENGYGKRTEVDEYRLQSRGGKGVINVKTTARNGMVVAILLVDEESEAMIISQYGKIIRVDTSEIREAGRSTQGVRLLQLEPGDKVAAASIIPPEEKDNGNGTLIQ
ncbi:MAG TPA: DNA gyrase subunit A, partial [Terriglobales bacterium]|nr:DNA gyrase subunit A [Terriglobales bacterium]